MNGRACIPAAVLQLTLPRPISASAASLLFTKPLATALDASSTAVGRESGSGGHGRHAAVARKRCLSCRAFAAGADLLELLELLKCPSAQVPPAVHTRRRLLDSTSARYLAARGLAVNVTGRSPDTHRPRLPSNLPQAFQ